MERIIRTRTFTRWMRKSGLSDTALLDAVSEMRRGLIDADLGGHLVKKRVALPGRGKRASARTIVATNMDNRWFFLFGFNKNERTNIDQNELKMLQETARDLLAFSEQQLAIGFAAGEISEVVDGQE